MTFSSVAVAFTTSTSSSRKIEPTKKDFKNARNKQLNKKYTSCRESLSGRIYNDYNLDIWHWEAPGLPSGGYYSFYSEGNLDTIGKVYEEQDAFGVYSYKSIKKNDDSKIDRTGKNFNITIPVDRFEDYYICVRAFGNKTGKYTLKIEPNEDKTTYRSFGKWTSEEMPYNILNSLCWVDEKDYLTKDEAFLLYLLVCDDVTYITDKDGKKHYKSQINKILRSAEKAEVSKLEKVFKFAFLNLTGCLSTELGITVSTIDFLYSEFVTSNNISSGNLCTKLRKTCHITHGVSAASKMGDKYNIDNGIIIQKNSIYGIDKYEYSKYTGGAMKGVEYYKGKWKFYN